MYKLQIACCRLIAKRVVVCVVVRRDHDHDWTPILTVVCDLNRKWCPLSVILCPSYLHFSRDLHVDYMYVPGVCI